jgi:hypothetical protein
MVRLIRKYKTKIIIMREIQNIYFYKLPHPIFG